MELTKYLNYLLIQYQTSSISSFKKFPKTCVEENATNLAVLKTCALFRYVCFCIEYQHLLNVVNVIELKSDNST